MADVNPGQGMLRVVRGSLLAAASIAVPAAAHGAAGGGVPVDGPFLFGVALLAVACIALADRRRTPGAIAAVIGLTQPVLHTALALSSHNPATVSPTPRMIIAHAAATVVLTLLLAGGEEVLWSMAALACTVLGAVIRFVVPWSAEPLPAAPAHRSNAGLPPPRRLAITSAAPRRGPPHGVSI